VKQLDELTVQHSNTIGLSGSNFVCGDFAQLVTFKVRCKVSLLLFLKKKRKKKIFTRMLTLFFYLTK